MYVLRWNFVVALVVIVVAIVSDLWQRGLPWLHLNSFRAPNSCHRPSPDLPWFHRNQNSNGPLGPSPLSGYPLARKTEGHDLLAACPLAHAQLPVLPIACPILRRFLFVLISTHSSGSGGKRQVTRRRSRRGGAAAGGNGAGSAGDVHKFHLSLSCLLFALRGINLGNFLFSNCTILVVFHF